MLKTCRKRETTVNVKIKTEQTKLRIAQQCARLVKPGGTILIDTSTTNLAMAEALPPSLR